MALYLLGLIGAYVAYLIGRVVCIRYPQSITVLWGGILSFCAGVIVNIIAIILYGTILETQGYRFLNLSMSFGQSFLWSLLGAISGVTQGRRQIATGKSEGFGAIFDLFGSTGAKVVLGVAAVATVLVIAFPPLLGNKMSPEARPAPQPSPITEPIYSPAANPFTDPDFGKDLVNIAPPPPPAPPPVQKTPAQTSLDIHYQRIYAAHPDADKVFASGVFHDWLIRNPQFLQTPENGTTSEIIEMFTKFKSRSPEQEQRIAENNRAVNEAAAEALSRQHDLYFPR